MRQRIRLRSRRREHNTREAEDHALPEFLRVSTPWPRPTHGKLDYRLRRVGWLPTQASAAFGYL